MPVLVNCDYCQKEFKQRRHLFNNNVHNFCSQICSGYFRRVDLVGQAKGKLKVLSFHSITSQGSMIECQCDCGKIFVTTAQYFLKTKCPTCPVCGKRRRYVEGISASYFCSLRYHAKEIGLEFSITQQDVADKFREQDGKCAYTGQDVFWQVGFSGERGTASVDRRDSKIGYTRENIQILHKYLNFIKSTFSEDHLLDICGSVANFDGLFTKIVNYQEPKRVKSWKGYGEISGAHFSKIRGRAKSYGQEFAVTIEYLWELFLDQGGVCALSGISLIFESCYAKISERTASLDRIDSAKGYVEGNVQWVLKDINKMKNEYSQDYFKNACTKMYHSLKARQSTIS